MAIDPVQIKEEVLQADRRIRDIVRETWLEPCDYLGGPVGAEVLCKLENLQITGSFKLRGAANKILSLSEEERERGVVTASTGNHGAATAYVLKRTGGRGIVFVPEDTPASKTEAISALGSEISYYGNDCADTEVHARGYALENGMTFISPYNDPVVIGGQGTIAMEIERQAGKVDAVFAAVGGGGMASGIGSYLKSVYPDSLLIGCSPENSPVMARSVESGKILEMTVRPTLSEGTAGGMESGSITFDLCSRLVDEYVLVTEAEIASSLVEFMEKRRMLMEGAAAVAVAAWLKTRERFRGKRVVIVICGANIGRETLARALALAGS